MVLIEKVSEFGSAAINMVKNKPKKTRLTTKFRKDKKVFVLKLTDGPETIKCNISNNADFDEAQKLISSLLHLMSDEALLGQVPG